WPTARRRECRRLREYVGRQAPGGSFFQERGAPMTRQRPRTGYTLIELLVVIAIMGVLAGLLLPGVHKVRESANLTQCRNQIKQLALACHTYHNDFSRLPPGIGWSQGYGNGLFHLLPYIEQNNLYKKSEAGDILFAGNNNIYASPIPLLQCP